MYSADVLGSLWMADVIGGVDIAGNIVFIVCNMGASHCSSGCTFYAGFYTTFLEDFGRG